MDFTVKSGHPGKQRTACVVAGVFESQRLSPAAEQVDITSDGYLSSLLRRGDLEGKMGQTLLLHDVPNVLSDRVLLVGCGKERELDEARYRKIIAKATSALNSHGIKEAVYFLSDLEIRNRDMQWKMSQAVVAAEDVCYRFERFLSKKKTSHRHLHKIVLNVHGRSDLAAGEEGIRIGKAIAGGVSMTKDLGNLPANICTPSYLADEARNLTKRHKQRIKVKVLELAEMEKLGMGALLSVARGSRQPPKLIILEYTGAKKTEKPVALVGKGVTFDSGGISIKPAASMDEMKYDMCGAASVLGTFSTVAELGLPINIVGVIPATENLPDGNASKPGDIVKSLSGQTIEILNTDAEGRLILCDALTYSERYHPDVVIDIATLTGACVVALGKHASGLLSNHPPLCLELLAAGQESGDRAWELPLWDDYQDQLKSNFADMANIGGREAGTITAACFLSRYTKKFHWAHLDIAGTAWLTGDRKGATGRPVPLLTQYLLNRVTGKSERDV